LKVDEYEDGGKMYFYSSKHYIYGLLVTEHLRSSVRSKREINDASSLFRSDVQTQRDRLNANKVKGLDRELA